MSLNRREFLELAAATDGARPRRRRSPPRAQDSADVIRIGIAANGPRTSDPEPDHAGLRQLGDRADVRAAGAPARTATSR